MTSPDFDLAQRFAAEMASLKVSEAHPRRPIAMRWAGVAVAVIGLALAVVAYSLSYGTKNPLQQNDQQILAVIGLGLIVIGCTLFLCGALTHFMRHWLARFVFEQRLANGVAGEVSLPSTEFG